MNDKKLKHKKEMFFKKNIDFSVTLYIYFLFNKLLFYIYTIFSISIDYFISSIFQNTKK